MRPIINPRNISRPKANSTSSGQRLSFDIAILLPGAVGLGQLALHEVAPSLNVPRRWGWYIRHSSGRPAVESRPVVCGVRRHQEGSGRRQARRPRAISTPPVAKIARAMALDTTAMASAKLSKPPLRLVKLNFLSFLSVWLGSGVSTGAYGSVRLTLSIR